MNKFSKIGLCGLTLALAATFSGCETMIKVDSVQPAKEVADVSKVNVAVVRVKADVKGNLASKNAQCAELVRQLISSRLCKEGFYKVVDGISGTAEGASELEKMLKDSKHGYVDLMAMEQGNEKVVIDVDLDLTLDAKPVQKEMSFTLKTVPYKPQPVKEGQVPTSVPDPKATTVETVKQPVTVYETVATGTMKVKFAAPKDKECPVAYAKTFTVAMPKEDQFDSAKPSALKALAAAVTPAVNGLVSDISPYRKTSEVAIAKGGDKRVATLLEAKDFNEVAMVVDKLDLIKAAVEADYVNLGIALEALGDFHGAKRAYKKAVDLNPEAKSEAGMVGLKRVEEALAGKKAVKASGAKQNKDTKFSK